jgi:hypothetical protein
MNRPRGRPFQPGNKMGRGRPKGSRNKTRAEVLQLLDRSEVPIVAQCIRQAVDGHFPSQRLVVDLIQRLPAYRFTPSRVGKIQSFEDLRNAAEGMLRQMIRGDITSADAKTTMYVLEQMGQLLEQRTHELKSQRPPKQILPDFMLEALRAARNSPQKLVFPIPQTRFQTAWHVCD